MQTWAGCAVPEDRLYDVDLDVWVRIEGQLARIGMTDVAQTRMGRLVQLSWKAEGRRVERGRPLSVLESAKWVGPICTPLSGTVVATNEATFAQDIAAANRDPYEAGWLYLIAFDTPEELEGLLGPEDAYRHYRALIDREGIQCFRCAE